jgi:hypothetical protein
MEDFQISFYTTNVKKIEYLIAPEEDVKFKDCDDVKNR